MSVLQVFSRVFYFIWVGGRTGNGGYLNTYIKTKSSPNNRPIQRWQKRESVRGERPVQSDSAEGARGGDGPQREASRLEGQIG